MPSVKQLQSRINSTTGQAIQPRRASPTGAVRSYFCDETTSPDGKPTFDAVVPLDGHAVYIRSWGKDERKDFGQRLKAIVGHASEIQAGMVAWQNEQNGQEGQEGAVSPEQLMALTEAIKGEKATLHRDILEYSVVDWEIPSVTGEVRAFSKEALGKLAPELNETLATLVIQANSLGESEGEA